MTISRRQRFDLKPIPDDLIIGRLKKIALEEKIKVTDGALACIARMADGGMRDAQSIFDQDDFPCAEIAEPDVPDTMASWPQGMLYGCRAAAGDHQQRGRARGRS